MKKRILSLLCVLALCLGLLPTMALAAAPSGQVIYVGNENVTSGGYWTTDSAGTVTAYTGQDTPTDNYIYYDAGTNILTLHNATIKESLDYSDSNGDSSFINSSAIGVLNQHGNAELTIQLEGSNTIAEVSQGIYVLAHSQSTGSSSLTITGNGSLDTSGSQFCIRVQSNSSDAALSIENAKVTATVVDGYGGNGVFVQSSENSSVSLTVNSGSLTATGRYAYDAGILLQFGSGGSGSGTPTVTVSGNAVVDAKNGGIANNSTTPIQYGTGSNSTGGIVWNGSNGTVYGEATLQEDISIGESESLTIGDGANLTVPEGTTLTNNGTVTAENGGTLTNNGTIDNSGTLTNGGTVTNNGTITIEEGGSVTNSGTLTNDGTINVENGGTLTGEPTGGNGKVEYKVTGVTLNQSAISLTVGGNETLIPTITPENATNKNLTWTSDAENIATVDTTGKVTAVAPGTANITVTTEDGGFTATCAVTVNQPVTGVKLDTTELSLYTGESETLTAKVEPADATNQDVTWSSNNNAVATVENGTVKAVGEGEATITVTTADGGKQATCKVKVTDPVYKMTTDTANLDFGKVYTGYDRPTAKTVTITNTGNQSLTLEQPASTNSFEVGTLSDTELAPNEKATFTVQPKADLAVGSHEESINLSGSNGNNTVSTSVGATFAVVDINDTSVDNKLTITSGISAGISGTAFTTPEAVKAELTRVLVQDAAYTAGNTAFYDVKLQYSLDGGQTWFDATEATFPTEGITVTLPYPSGTGKDTHNFRVVHMFTVTSTRLGTEAGKTETPAVTKTDSGLQVTLRGLSPVVIGWDKIETPSSGGSTTPAATATPAPSDNITYYTCPSCGYHNWTATDAGYRCDNCGYLESTKQLSGYGNVKGTYTPGSGATSTAASTVPQTGDESNPVLWTVLLLVSGLALGGLAIAKRKKQQ